MPKYEFTILLSPIERSKIFSFLVIKRPASVTTDMTIEEFKKTLDSKIGKIPDEINGEIYEVIGYDDIKMIID